MRKAIGYLAFCAFALAMGGCSLAPVNGTLAFPDGSKVQYTAATVETSAFNSSVIVATKAPDGTVKTDVKSGTGMANAVMQSATAVAQGMGFWIPFCAAGNC